MPSTPTDYANDHVTTLRASMTSKTQTSAITGNPLEHNGATDSWQITGPQILRFSKGKFVEYIYAPSASVDATTKVITWPASSTVTRDITWKDGASITQLTTGVKKWSAGTKIELVWAANQAEQTPFKDVANTFSAVQTINAGLIVSGTSSYVKLPELTTTQRDNLTPGEGMLIKNTTTGTVQQYVGGAWASIGTDTTANGSTTVAGKFEEATVAEQGAATATGGTGARLVPANANLIKTSAGAADENKLVVMNSAGVVDVSAGGTGVRNPTSGSLYIGAGSSAMTAVAPGSSGNVLKSNGTTWTSGSTTSTMQCVYASGASSATLTNPSGKTEFDTHTYDIPANDLVAGVGYEFDVALAVTCGVTQDVDFFVSLEGTTMVTFRLSSMTTGDLHLKGMLMGTAAAGAAVAVRGIMSGKTSGFFGSEYTATNAATNSILTLSFAIAFNTANAGNNATATMARIDKFSSTAF